METLRLMYVVFGLLLVLLSIPLMGKRVPPNLLYGFRVPSTLKDPELWYETNSYSGRWVLAAGVVLVLAAILLSRLGLSVDAYAWACLGAFLLVMVPGVISSFVKLNQMKRKEK